MRGLIVIILCVGLLSFAESDSVSLNNLLSEISAHKYDTPQKVKLGVTKISLLPNVNQSAFFKSKCFSILGEVFRITGDFDSSKYYLQKAIDIRELYNYDVYAASSHEHLANLYFSIEQNSEAFKHLYISLALKQKDNTKTYIKSVYNGLGNAHFNLNNSDSAIFYYSQALKLNLELKDSSGIANTYNNIGVLYYNESNYNQALKFYRNSLNIYQSQNQIGRTIIPLLDIGICHYEQGAFDSALYYYKKSLAASKATGNNEHTDYIILSIAEAYGELGQSDSAVTMFTQYIAYRDSVFSQDKVNAILEYETKYQTKEIEMQAAIVKAEKQKIEAEDKSKRKTIYVLAAILVLIVILLIFIARNSRQKTKISHLEIDSKNKEINSILKAQEAKSYAALLEGQNTERERIAQDLHDRLGGTLAAVKIHFNQLDEKIDAIKTENKLLFSKVDEMLGEAVLDVRRISHDLTSNHLDKLGLKGAVTDLVNAINTSKKVTVELVYDDSLPALSPKFEQEIYAVIQELISNTLKHANANHIELQLTLQEKSLTLIYEDDGIGFSLPLEKNKGLGLTSIENRIAALKGNINFDTVLGRGTIIIINTPL